MGNGCIGGIIYVLGFGNEGGNCVFEKIDEGFGYEIYGYLEYSDDVD